MRLERTIFVTLAAGLSAACGQASAATPDSSNDIDCSVIAFYFSSEAERIASPPSQRRALNSLQEWYSKRVQAVAAEGGADKVLGRASPVLEAVKRDPMSMRDDLAACTDRAVKDGLM